MATQPRGKESGSAAVPRARRRAAGVLLGWHRLIAPKKGWLWPLGRDALLRFAGELPVEEKGSREIPGVGPIGELTLHQLGVERSARPGLEKATLPGFRDEYAPLLSGEGLLSQWILSYGEAARSLEEAEVRALAGFVEDDAIRKALADALAHLKQNPTRPIADSLAESLDRLWHEGLGNKVRLTFLRQALAEEPPRTATANSQSQAEHSAPHTPLSGSLQRLELLERELQEATAKGAAKEDEGKVERLPPVDESPSKQNM